MLGNRTTRRGPLFEICWMSRDKTRTRSVRISIGTAVAILIMFLVGRPEMIRLCEVLRSFDRLVSLFR